MIKITFFNYRLYINNCYFIKKFKFNNNNNNNNNIQKISFIKKIMSNILK
jgi:hypothetical protein